MCSTVTREKMLTSPFSILRRRVLRSMFRTASTLPLTLSSFTIRLTRPRHLPPLPSPPRASLSPPHRSLRRVRRRRSRRHPVCLFAAHSNVPDRTRSALSGREFLGTCTLLLSCPGHILWLRSVTGRTTGWAQAHFFVGPVGVD